MKCLEKLLNFVGILVEKTFFPNLEEEYKWYQDCFKGTPEEVERKLHVWDYIHKMTRESDHYK